MMKKKRSIAGMLILELAVGAAEIALVGAAVFGALYAIGLFAEIFDGFVTVSSAVFVLFTIAGVLLYCDFRPSETKNPSVKRTTDRKSVCGMSERKAIRAYSAR